MMVHSPAKFDKNRINNLGFVRLFFAALVVIAHSPELVDGNTSREILSRIFSTMSFGEVAVRGFFVVSGYLITKSFVEGRSTASYLAKRTLRIVPGYLVSFLACVLFLAPLVGGTEALLSTDTENDLLLRILTLRSPAVPGVFHGMHDTSLNGPMWTIAYEFRCYLATALFGLLGFYKPRYRTFLLAALICVLVLSATGIMRGRHTAYDEFHGIPRYTVEFAGVFGAGALYYLFRDKVPLTNGGALTAALLLIALLFNTALASTAVTIFGGYLIFWFAFEVRVFGISRLVNKADISYGLYLYAWPIQNLLIWNDRTINPWLLCCITLLAAGLLGYASWKLVEKPMLRFAHRRRVVTDTGVRSIRPAI